MMADNAEAEPDAARPRYLERTKRGGWFVNDAELIELLGVPENYARAALRVLDNDRASGFPKKQKLWGDRRYWPAVQAWFDFTYVPASLRKELKRVRE